MELQILIYIRIILIPFIPPYSLIGQPRTLLLKVIISKYLSSLNPKGLSNILLLPLLRALTRIFQILWNIWGCLVGEILVSSILQFLYCTYAYMHTHAHTHTHTYTHHCEKDFKKKEKKWVKDFVKSLKRKLNYLWHRFFKGVSQAQLKV